MLFLLTFTHARLDADRLVAVCAAAAPQIEAWKPAHLSLGVRIWAAPGSLPQDALDRIAVRLGVPRPSPGSEESLNLRIVSVASGGRGLYDVRLRLEEVKDGGSDGRCVAARVRVARGEGTVVSQDDPAQGARYHAVYCGGTSSPPKPSVPSDALRPEILRVAQAVVRTASADWISRTPGGSIDLHAPGGDLSTREMRALYESAAPPRGRFDPLSPLMRIALGEFASLGDGRFRVGVEVSAVGAHRLLGSVVVRTDSDGRTVVEKP